VLLTGEEVDTLVSVGATVSGLLGLVASALPAGARVVSVEGEFTSLLWPFLVRGEVRCVPLTELAEAAADADVVAFSAVQSATGEVADLEDEDDDEPWRRLDEE